MVSHFDVMYTIIHHLAVSLTELFTSDAIMDFQRTPESARSAIAQADESLEFLAFATITNLCVVSPPRSLFSALWPNY
jgi:hypothetical protein